MTDGVKKQVEQSEVSTEANRPDGDSTAKASAPPKPAAVIPDKTAAFFSDLEKVRLSLDEAGDIGSREILVRVPVRKPRKSEFIQCHPDPAMSLAVTIYVDRENEDEVFFVAPSMRGILAEDLKPVLLQLATTRKGVLFIWPLTLPSEENPLGRSWHESARKAAEISKGQWVRVFADKSLGGYRVRLAEGNLSPPEWPVDKTFSELLTIAFADRIITTEDHPVVRRLRGLV
jgi:hypothetical protein